MASKTESHASVQSSSPDEVSMKPAGRRSCRQAAAASGRRGQRGRRRGTGEKTRGVKEKRRGQEEKKEGVTVKRTWSDGKRRWDKKHYCVFCRRPQVKIARHLLRKHADQQEVAAASTLPTGSKQRHLLLEHLRCRGNYLHNIEVCLPVHRNTCMALRFLFPPPSLSLNLLTFVSDRHLTCRPLSTCLSRRSSDRGGGRSSRGVSPQRRSMRGTTFPARSAWASFFVLTSGNIRPPVARG